MSVYLFESQRLGFRNWCTEDFEPFASMNADPRVMRYFPKQMSADESLAAIKRFEEHRSRRNFCYFAVDLLETGRWIGFIGLMTKSYPFSTSEVVDIGWRLVPEVWRNGLAAEGAGRCLELAKMQWKIDQVVAVAPEVNLASVAVMKKIGMQFGGRFVYDVIPAESQLNPCVYYVKNLVVDKAIENILGKTL